MRLGWGRLSLLVVDSGKGGGLREERRGGAGAEWHQGRRRGWDGDRRKHQENGVGVLRILALGFFFFDDRLLV